MQDLNLKKGTEENDLDEDILLTASLTEYSNDKWTLKWLEHFEIHSWKSQMEIWRLLILDGYKSYLTYKFYEYAQKYYIELFWLSLHSIHLTKLLDVGCFQPLKYHQKESIDDSIQSSSKAFGKLDFLAKFQFIRTQIFQKSTSKSVFKTIGLIFYNPKIILQKICAPSKLICILIPSPLDPTYKMTLIYATTISHLHEVKSQAQTLINRMKKKH